MKFTQDNPQIDTATYIRPPIDKKAVGDLFKNVAALGENVYTNYQVGSLRDEVNKEVQAYENAYQAQGEAADAANLMQGQREAVNAAWESDAMMGRTDIDAVNKMEVEYRNQLGRFQNAASQGKISEEELVARINKTTREFVNRNPWMEKQFYAAAQEHLRNTGVGDILKYRQDLVKEAKSAERDDYKAIRNALITAGVPGGWMPGMGMDQMLSNLMHHQKAEYTVKMWDNWDKLQTNMSKEQGRRMVPYLMSTGVYQIVNDRSRKWASDLTTITSPTEVTSYLAGMQQQANNELMLMRVRLAELEVDPASADKVIKAMEDSFKSEIGAVSSMADGKKAAEILKNRADYQEVGQRIQVANQVNLPALAAAKDIMANLPLSDRIAFAQTIGIDKFFDNSAKLLERSFSQTKETQEFVSSGNASNMFGAYMRQMETDPSAPVGQKMNNIKGMVLSMGDVYSGNIPEDKKHISINNSLDALAKAPKFFASQAPDTELISALKPQIDFHMNKYGQDLFVAMEKVKAINSDVEFTVDLTPSGGLIVHSNYPLHTEQFNASFGRQINNALDAWANVNGISREKAAPEFFREYLGPFVKKDGKLNTTHTQEVGISVVKEKQPAPTSVEALKANNDTREAIMRKYAAEFEKSKADKAAGKITAKQHGNNASDINRRMKEELNNLGD